MPRDPSSSPRRRNPFRQSRRTAHLHLHHPARFSFLASVERTVTAQTFKATIERTLDRKMHSPVAGEFANIVGAADYMAGRSPRIAGVLASGRP